MPNIDLNTYFESYEDRYYDSKYLITILEDLLGCSIDHIRENVHSMTIDVTSEEIKGFLERTFDEEDPELRARIEHRRNRKNRLGNTNFSDPAHTREAIRKSSEAFVDDLSATKYYFEPYTLEYFFRYTGIVRNKALLLLSIIERIGKGEIDSVQTLLSDFDIVLDEEGNIARADIIRLITPTIHNINALSKKVLEANDLRTYLTFKMSKHSLLRNDISESEIYPPASLQIKSLHYAHVKGNIPFSDRQREELKEEQRKSSEYFTKWLLK